MSTLKPSKPMKWQELKDFCNSLNEVELQKNVIVWGEDRGETINSAYQLEEEHLYDGEAMCPLSVFDEDQLEEHQFNERMHVGTPILGMDEYDEVSD